MKKRQQLSLVILLAGITFTGNALSKIYTWTDENGKVHFSDKPVINQKAATIKPKVNTNIAKTVTSDSQWQQNYLKTKAEKAEKAKENAEQKRKKQIFCNVLKSKLATLEHGGRFYSMSPEGEQSYYSDEQLKAKHQKLTKAYKKSCR